MAPEQPVPRTSIARTHAHPARERNGSAGSEVRVLIACDHIDYDGALHGGGRQLVELVQALEPTPITPTVCVLRAPSPLGRRLQRDGFPISFLGDARFSPASLVKLIRLIRERRIDVLHLTDFGACTFGRIAGALAGTPSIVQVICHHSPLQARGFPWYVELAYRALAPLTARALAISESVRRFAITRMGFSPDQVEVLHYPLPRYSFTRPADHEIDDVRRHHRLHRAEVVIGAVTRFFPAKGIRYLITAFGQVLRRCPGARLVLVGQGPEEPALREQCRRERVAEQVVFAGYQREAQKYVGAFDVSVVPSLEEGFGLVAVESLALGVPVVASRVGGLADIVVDGYTGKLVEPANPHALASAILDLVTDPDLRERMSRNSSAVAERFALDRYVDRLVQIYTDLAGPAGPRGANSTYPLRALP